jgi:hypothetical protein
MALLTQKEFKRINKERNSIHVPVAAGYTVFTYANTKIFQIDTYGTTDRQEPGKLSQSIQIDKPMAEILVSKLKEVFELE